MESAVVHYLKSMPVTVHAATLAAIAGVLAAVLTRRSLRAVDTVPDRQPVVYGLVAALLTGLLTLAVLKLHCQEIPEVRPSVLWWYLRPAFHALLIVLLVDATATDLRTYYILDSTTLTGMFLGVVLATIAGDLQLAHVWVDWNQEVPQLRGPYIPDWLSAHPHLHGLAWSLAGLVMGAGVTWLARVISTLVLGQEALGFGDVTLMGMIGAFLGWQPLLLVFLLAPLCALVTGLIVRMLSAKTYVPYGPYLSLAAVVVLFGWRGIWLFEWQLATTEPGIAGASSFAVRRLFGDAAGLGILAAMVFGGLILLLGALRIYRSLPVRSTGSTQTADDAPQP